MTYREVQKIRKPWIWIGITVPGMIITGLFGFGMNRQIIQGQPFGNHPMSDPGLIMAFFMILFLFVFLALLVGFANLTTVADETGVSYRFFPFQMKFHKIPWDTVGSCGVITYNPVRDYGGWGVRSGKNGKAYNISGNTGLQLQLKTGEIILIGTQKKPELVDFLILCDKIMD
jgi:hypothetical protein